MKYIYFLTILLTFSQPANAEFDFLKNVVEDFADEISGDKDIKAKDDEQKKAQPKTKSSEKTQREKDFEQYHKERRDMKHRSNCKKLFMFEDEYCIKEKNFSKGLHPDRKQYYRDTCSYTREKIKNSDCEPYKIKKRTVKEVQL